jgi:hypothetical protein
MLDLANDIRSLSEFKRNTVDLLDRLRRTGVTVRQTEPGFHALRCPRG